MSEPQELPKLTLREVIERGTASQLDRAMKCVGSLILPAVETHSSKAATKGTDIHAFVERARKMGREAALAGVPTSETRAICEKLDLSMIPENARSEVALGYLPESGQVVLYPEAEHRHYPHDGAFHATLDLYWKEERLDGDVAVVVDLKTGMPVVAAKDANQLRIAALMVSRLYQVEKAKVALWYLQEDGTWDMDWAEFNAWDLQDIEDDFRNLVDRLVEGLLLYNAGGVPAMATGPWCRYCKSIEHCPAQTSLVKAMGTSLRTIDAGMKTLSPELAGDAWVKLQDYKRLLARVEEALKVYASTGPIPLRNGQVVKEISYPIFDIERGGMERLAELVGIKQVLKFVSMTKKSVVDNFGEEVLQTLDAEGYITKRWNTKVQAVGKPVAR